MARSIKKFGISILILALAMVMILPMLSISGVEKAEAATPVLKVLNWGDYIAEAEADVKSVIEQFEEMHGVKVVYTTAETNELMLNVVSSDADVDILCPSDYAIEKLIKQDKIQKLDLTKLTNIGNIEQRLYDKMDEVFGNNNGKGKMDEFMVPYMYGTLGVMYNTKVIDPEDAREAGYGVLWNSFQNKNLEKKVLMKDSVRDAMSATVLHLRETNRLPDRYKDMTVAQLMNNTDSDLLKLVEDCLIEQKKNKALKKYEVDDGKGEMEKGTAYANLAWSGDAVASMAENEDLDYFVPEVGGNIWFDGWVITKDSKNVDLAHKFINFLCDPVVAARNTVYIGYTSAVSQEALKNNAEALAIIEDGMEGADAYFADEIAYPDLDDPDLAVMRDYGDKESDIITMWERVKNYGNINKILGIVFGVLGGAIVIAVVVIIILKKTSRKGKIAKVVAKPETDSEDEEDDDDESDVVEGDLAKVDEFNEDEE